MGLFLQFFGSPAPPLMFNYTDNGLPARVNVNVLNCDFLLALAAISPESLHLQGESPRELGEGALSALALESVIRVSETTGRRHGG